MRRSLIGWFAELTPEQEARFAAWSLETFPPIRWIHSRLARWFG